MCRLPAIYVFVALLISFVMLYEIVRQINLVRIRGYHFVFISMPIKVNCYIAILNLYGTF
jgi:hypothetical protein